MTLITALIVAILACATFILARARAVQVAGGQGARLHSRPGQHGIYGLLLTAIIGFGIYLAIFLAASYWQQFSLHGDIAAPRLLGGQRFRSDYFTSFRTTPWFIRQL